MNRYFYTKLCVLVVLLLGIGYYQVQAKDWEKQETENQRQIAEVEQYNKSIEQNNKSAGQNDEKQYTDGTYQGVGEGFGGEIVVLVTIEQNKISKIEIESAKKEDEAYFSMAKELLGEIVKEQSADVEAVSGATYSSNGIKAAVQEALDTAKA